MAGLVPAIPDCGALRFASGSPGQAGDDVLGWLDVIGTCSSRRERVAGELRELDPSTRPGD